LFTAEFLVKNKKKILIDKKSFLNVNTLSILYIQILVQDLIGKENALKTIGLSRILPGIKTIKEGVLIYLKFVKLETQIENGVLLIHLKLMYLIPNIQIIF